MTVHIIRSGQMLEIGSKTETQRKLMLRQPEGPRRIPERILQGSMLARAPETNERDGKEGELRRVLREANLGRMTRTRSGLVISTALAAALAVAGCDSAVNEPMDSDANIDTQEETDSDVEAGDDETSVPDAEVTEDSDEGDVAPETSEDGVVDEGSEADAESGEDSGDAEAEVPGCEERVRAETAAPLSGPEAICEQEQQTNVTETVTENVGPECETPGETGRFVSTWDVVIGPGASLDPAGLVCARGVDTRTPDGVRTIVTLAADRLATALSLGKSGTLYVGDVFSVGVGEPYILIDNIGPLYATVNEYSAGPPASFTVYYGINPADPEYSDVPRFTNRGLVAILDPTEFSIRLVLIDTSTFTQETTGAIRSIRGRDYEWTQRRDIPGGVQGWVWVNSAL